MFDSGNMNPQRSGTYIDTERDASASGVISSREEQAMEVDELKASIRMKN